MRMYFRFYEPKLIEVNKTRYTDSLFVKHKAQIAMMNDEKLRDLNVSVQQEMNTLSWLCSVAPAFPVNGTKVK